jgi:hypothetical protein
LHCKYNLDFIKTPEDKSEGAKPVESEGANDKIAIENSDTANIEVNLIINDNGIEGVINTTIEGATQKSKSKLMRLLSAIADHEYERFPYYEEVTGLSAKSIERYVKQLRENGLIGFS